MEFGAGAIDAAELRRGRLGGEHRSRSSKSLDLRAVKAGDSVAKDEGRFAIGPRGDRLQFLDANRYATEGERNVSGGRCGASCVDVDVRDGV
jgi:hypothetical protein